MALALENVTVNTVVYDPVHVDAESVFWCETVVVAVVFGQPAATEAASVARSVATAEAIAIVSPVLTALDVSVSPVCPATVAIAENSEFHCDAFTVPPTSTVTRCDSPSPYSPDPVPAK